MRPRKRSNWASRGCWIQWAAAPLPTARRSGMVAAGFILLLHVVLSAASLLTNAFYLLLAYCHDRQNRARRRTLVLCRTEQGDCCGHTCCCNPAAGSQLQICAALLWLQPTVVRGTHLLHILTLLLRFASARSAPPCCGSSPPWSAATPRRSWRWRGRRTRPGASIALLRPQVRMTDCRKLARNADGTRRRKCSLQLL